MSAIPLMGYAARLNPRSFEGAISERAVRNARIDRFCRFFPDRTAYEQYLDRFDPPISPEHRAYLESRLPARLQKGGTV